MADSLLQITVGVVGEDPTRFADRMLGLTGNAHTADGFRKLVAELAGMARRPHKVLARVDSVTRGAAAGTLVADVSDATTGDELHIRLPGAGLIAKLTVVASSPTYAAGEVDGSAATDTLFGDEFVSAIQGHPVLSKYFTASNSTGTVTVTCKDPGTWGNNVTFIEKVTSNSPFAPTSPSGGDDILDQPSMTVTFGVPDIVADDTISIGARVYTWKASASADGEITLSTAEATAAANFAAAINADATWTGVLTASVNGAVVTLTFVGDPRLCQHITSDFAETNAGSVVLGGTVTVGTSEAPILDTTVTGSSTTRTWGARGAA